MARPLGQRQSPSLLGESHHQVLVLPASPTISGRFTQQHDLSAPSMSPEEAQDPVRPVDPDWLGFLHAGSPLLQPISLLRLLLAATTRRRLRQRLALELAGIVGLSAGMLDLVEASR